MQQTRSNAQSGKPLCRARFGAFTRAAATNDRDSRHASELGAGGLFDAIIFAPHTPRQFAAS